MRELISKLNKWANSNTTLGTDLLRVALGILLFVKGIQFAQDSSYLVDLINAQNPEWASLLIAHYITMAHFAGGLLIIFGLITRLAILVQLPLIIGAFIIHIKMGTDAQALIMASIALLFAVFFLFFGSGKHSVDYELKLHM
ncbi:MAG: DoxX family protein [Crocinitomicaceae bacterium]|nr:DoxX family protein [Crocinitomicaceae bacterium]